MSNLYIKVFTDFYANRKTARLRAKIGDDAMWIPPRLWAYAAEHQSDGDFSGYSSEELAFLLGCNKHASSILEALKECGFIDETGIIHDWEEHNGFHSTFSERAKTAAKARWAKKEKKQKKELSNTETDTETETSIASSMLQASRSPENGFDHGSATTTPPAPEKPQGEPNPPQGKRPRKRVEPMQIPSIEEVKLHAAKIGLPETEAFKFHGYYESNGWRVGKNPMKSWVGAMTNWKGNYDERRTGQRLIGTSTPDDSGF